MLDAVAGPREGTTPLASHLIAAFSVGAVVFIACLFGILTRPMGSLAAFWPANALLLGMMVRGPRFANFGGWLGAFLGYIAADISTGGNIGITIWLTVANMAGAITGYLLFSLRTESDRKLRRPLSVLFLFGICATAALVAAFVGGGAARVLFGRDFLTGLEFWFVTELVNSLVILPAILTFPVVPQNWSFTIGASPAKIARKAAPAVALLASVIMGVVVGGPGAVAFAVPALLWCALSYSVFVTAVLTLVFCSWLLVAVSSGLIDLKMQGDVLRDISSLRLGIALMALAPLTAASINSARMDLMRQLAHSANHDELTGILNRRAVLERAAERLASSSTGTPQVTVLMLDIDYFKQVNDRHGHMVGDDVLIAFTRVVSGELRPDDLFGRMGGEEFVVVLFQLSPEEALAVAERLRQAVSRMTVGAEGGDIRVTVSIGLAARSGAGLELLLGMADQALYRAKAGGRDNTAVFR
ncbi:MAG TPA: diguanylate cyclase [Rhizobiaceae bacterium]|nr:diguanylate cyclase [Rhizobiaceae bacterium]